MAAPRKNGQAPTPQRVINIAVSPSDREFIVAAHAASDMRDVEGRPLSLSQWCRIGLKQFAEREAAERGKKAKRAR